MGVERHRPFARRAVRDDNHLAVRELLGKALVGPRWGETVVLADNRECRQAVSWPSCATLPTVDVRLDHTRNCGPVGQRWQRNCFPYREKQSVCTSVGSGRRS